jgi:hypothetical protein
MRFTPAGRGIAALMACIMLLTGCANQFAGVNLTPAQQQLKQANDRFSQTVGEGVVVGALALGLLGAGVGALAGGKKGALIGLAAGAAVGGAVGAALGYNVARNNYAQSKTEQNLRQLIAEATQDASAYHRSAAASRDIAAEAHTRIAALDAQYRAKKITAEQYKQAASTYKSSADIMQAQVSSSSQKITEMRTDATSQTGEDRSQLLNDARQVELARRALKESSDSLAASLAMVPS